MAEIKEAKQKQFGNLSAYNANDDSWPLYENGVVQIAKHEGLPV